MESSETLRCKRLYYPFHTNKRLHLFFMIQNYFIFCIQKHFNGFVIEQNFSTTHCNILYNSNFTLRSMFGLLSLVLILRNYGSCESISLELVCSIDYKILCTFITLNYFGNIYKSCISVR